MSVWDSYPSNYREHEVQAVLHAVQAGECVSIVGLSGAGKSNLMGFLAYRSPLAQSQEPSTEKSKQHLSAIKTTSLLIDCNRLTEASPNAFFRLIRHALGENGEASNELHALEIAINQRMTKGSHLCLLFDRFDALPDVAKTAICSNLRALRDSHKYALTYITATRRPLDPHTELAELFYAHTIWLGTLSESDARWSVDRYAKRINANWNDEITRTLIRFSRGYPSLLRAACEAAVEVLKKGAKLTPENLRQHPAIQRRLDEFWADAPGEDEMKASGLNTHPLLMQTRPPDLVDDSQLTAKEHLLLKYFRGHPNQVSEKDDLIRAVWPEDRIFEQGVRDDSLAQLIRRLRQKIETDASNPEHIHTVPGRGYRFVP